MRPRDPHEFEQKLIEGSQKVAEYRKRLADSVTKKTIYKSLFNDQSETSLSTKGVTVPSDETTPFR